MSNMDQVMKEIEGGSDKSAETTTTTQPAETAPGETKPAEAPAETAKATEQKPKQKKDLSKVSAEDKAAYSFKKQLERQRKRDAQDFDKMLDSRFAEFKKQFEASAPKAAEAPKKTRKDFESDTEYVNYMIQEGIREALAKRDADHAKTAEEEKAKQEEAQKAQMIARRDLATMQANVDALYQGEELEAWKQRVAHAAQKGLRDVLDASPILKSFVMTSKWGPLVLDKMITDKDTLKRLMGPFSNPVEMQMELAQIAAEARAERAGGGVSEETREKPKGIHPMGRPGASSNAGGSGKGIFDNDDALIKFMRGRRRR